jgi:hypothetical protein
MQKSKTEIESMGGRVSGSCCGPDLQIPGFAITPGEFPTCNERTELP